MINWRKIVLQMTARILRRKMFRNFKFLKMIENETPEALNQRQEEKLIHLLKHSYINVPYYHKILDEAGVVKDGIVYLENFQNIPLLTKSIIRREGENLYSNDYKKRSWYPNSSGGSTGEPVCFIQDLDYKDWVFAGAFLYNSWGGMDVGEPELKLWGSERDIMKGRYKLYTKLEQWIFNTGILNAYKMSQEDMRKHIIRWNKIKPKQITAYTDSMYKLSRFVETEQICLHSPASIFCTTANLLPEAREHIERTFSCKVFNQYGSREVGFIASECQAQEGLHVVTTNQKLEILDSKGRSVKGENMGEIVITNLNNYSMPLIRYRIGDTGCFSNKPCSCGRGFPLLKEVSGRVFAHFVKKDGSVIHSQFFVALLFFKPWIREFKIVQKDYDLIEILLALEKEVDKADMEVITSKIRHVMGEDCKVVLKIVDEVPPTASGKYLYTISEVTE